MKPSQVTAPFNRIVKQEDWLAILIAFLFIVLSVAGVLGQNGIQIAF